MDNTTTYGITFSLTVNHDPSLCEYQDAQYTLEEAVDLATTYDVDIKLSDEAGFTRGWVKADGTWTLQ